MGHEMPSATTILRRAQNTRVPTQRRGGVDGCARKDRMRAGLRTNAPSRRGAPTRIPWQPPLRTGWHAPDGHAPDALAPQPRQHLSPPEAWRPRDGAVRRAHDAQPPVREVCLALTWWSFPWSLGCSCAPPSWVPEREESLFGGSRCSGCHWPREQSSKNPVMATNTFDAVSECRPSGRRSSRNSSPLVPRGVFETRYAALLPHTPSVGVRRDTLFTSRLVAATTWAEIRALVSFVTPQRNQRRCGCRLRVPGVCFWATRTVRQLRNSQMLSGTSIGARYWPWLHRHQR
jgi:hypothetical protein